MIGFFEIGTINIFQSGGSALTLFLVSIFFLSMGSFSSLLIYRLGLKETDNDKSINLFLPRSHCPRCKKQISLLNLIPILGFIKQLGKCNECNKPISLMYLFNELIHLLTGLLIIYFLQISLLSLTVYVLFFILYILFILDIKFFYLPLGLNYCLSGIGIISNGLFGFFVGDLSTHISSHLWLSLLGCFTGFVSLWVVNFIYKLINKRDGIGGGDFILFAGIGSITGPFSLAPILFLGSISALLIITGNLKKYSREVPLGSGLILGFIFYILLKYFELLGNILVI